jgi:hypothetical protein
MKSFQHILEECLTALSNDTATVDECLARYPQHAEQLKPLLGTIRYLKLGRSVKPSLTFKSYSRVHLTQHLHFNPRRSQWTQFLWRITATVAVLMTTLLVTGTVHAQTVLPGDNFYPWKRASEEIWRALSIDSINADITLSERRLNEWVAVADDPTLGSEAMLDYFEELDKLKQRDSVETHSFIAPVIQTHHEILDDAGLPGAELVESYVALVVTPPPVATNAQVFITNTSNPTFTSLPQPTLTLKPNPTVTSAELPPTATVIYEPTATPTNVPTMTPTYEPTMTPTYEPTITPTDKPTATDEPTATPTDAPPTAEAVPTETEPPPTEIPAESIP